MLEVVVEKEGEGLLPSELTVECAIEVVYLGFHAAVGFHKEVRMAFEQIPQVDLGQVWAVLLYQVKLLDKHILPTLKGKLGEGFHHGNDLTSFHLVMSSQVVENSDECLCLAAKNSSTLTALL